MKRLKRWVILTVTVLLFSFAVQAEVVYKIDFSEQKGNATDWFEKNNFKFQNDAKKVKAFFENGRLVLEANDINGIFTKNLNIKNASKIRIEWGVHQYPQGANWEKGLLREAVGVVVSFGNEKISSGSMVVPNVPYFVALFLGETEKEGKAYFGNYYKQGGRYFCQPCQNQTGKSVVTIFDLSSTFKDQFSKNTVPPISSISIEVDVRDTKGGSKAFIKTIELLSE